MRVEWLEKALKNLEDEANYIALENPKAADDFSVAIFASVDRLAQFPSMGREGRVKHTRERPRSKWQCAQNLPLRHPRSVPDKLRAIRLADSDPPCPYKPPHFPAASPSPP